MKNSVFYNTNIENYDKFYIPYRVVNGKRGKLTGFRPKAVKIDLGRDTEIREAIIAFCEDKLSEFSDYHALLPRGVI